MMRLLEFGILLSLIFFPKFLVADSSYDKKNLGNRFDVSKSTFVSTSAATVLNTAGGTYTIGLAGDFPNITGEGGVFQALNNLSIPITGPFTFLITENLFETGTYSLEEIDGASIVNFIEFRPDGSSERVVSGHVVNKGMLQLDGADFIIFDGRNPASSGTGEDEPKLLRFQNTDNTTSATFQYINGAQNNIIRYCYVEGRSNNSSWGIVKFDGSTTSIGNSNNVIEICNIGPYGDFNDNRANIGVYSLGNSAAVNENNSILNSNFYDFFANRTGAVHIDLQSYNNNWLIEGNSFYLRGYLNENQNKRFRGIRINNEGRFTLQNNFFGGSSPKANGLYDVREGNNGWVDLFFITIENSSDTEQTIIKNNIISNIKSRSFSPDGSGEVIGIMANNGYCLISDNYIGSLPDNSGGISVIDYKVGAGAIGIQLTGSGTYIMSNNKISNINVDAQQATAKAVLKGVVSNVTGTSSLTGNSILNNSVLGITTSETLNIGIDIWNAADISKTKIYGLNNTTTNASVAGIRINQTPRSVTIYNNLITLGYGQTNNSQLSGILTTGNSLGESKIYNNTIVIDGTSDISSRNTYGFFKSDDSPVDLKNNIFFNKRTGSGNHYAIGASSANNWSGSDYNLLFAINSATTGQWLGTDQTFDNLKVASSMDVNSRSANILAYFNDVSTGDLRISYSASASEIIDQGINLQVVTDDFDGKNRFGKYDIGASEIYNIWTGTISNDWFTSGNWSGNVVPGCSDNVLIPPLSYEPITVSNQPVINSNIANFKNLVIMEEASLALNDANSQLLQCNSAPSPNGLYNFGSLHHQGTISLHGDFSNSNTYVGNGTITFLGTATQNIDGTTPLSFNQITFDGDGDKQLLQSITVVSHLDFIKGTVKTTNADILIFGTGATSSISEPYSSFVEGPIRKMGNSDFVFHVGKNGIYRPIGISNLSGNSDFTVEYFDVDPDPLFSRNAKVGTLELINDKEYWKLSETSGNTANIKLYWESNDLGITHTGNLRVASWNGSQWDDSGNSETTGDIVSGSILSSTIASFNALTLASANSVNSIWHEDFNLADGAVVDNGSTAWSTSGTPTGYWEVRNFKFVGNNLGNEMVWQSEEIDISSYTNIGASVKLLSETTAALENDDYLKIYYKLDGGPEVLFEAYGAQNALFSGRYSEMGCGSEISGNTLQIVIKAKNSTSNEFYSFDDVKVFIRSAALFAIADGNWSDGSTWSSTEGGEPCYCIPDCGTDVVIKNFTVNLDQPSNAKSISLSNNGELIYTNNQVTLSLWNNSSVNIATGSKIFGNGKTDANISFNGIGDANILVDDIVGGIDISNLFLNTTGSVNVTGSGTVKLSKDLTVIDLDQLSFAITGLVSIGNNLNFLGDNTNGVFGSNLSIGNKLYLGGKNIQLQNNGQVQVTGNIQSNFSGTENSVIINNDQFSFQDIENTSGGVKIENRGELFMRNFMTISATSSFYNFDNAKWYYSGNNHDPDTKIYCSYLENIFNYNGADQNIINPQNGYYHLELTNTGTKFTTAPLTIGRDLILRDNVVFDASISGHDIILGDDFQSYSSGVDPFKPGTNRVTLLSTSNNHSIESVNGITFYDLIVDTGDGLEVDFREVVILHNLHFNKGLAYTRNDGVLVISDNATITGTGISNFIDGKIKKIGDDPFLFPLGNNGYYFPLTISAPSNLSDGYTAQYFNVNPHTHYNTTLKQEGIHNISTCSYWILESTSTNSVDVTLSWQSNCPVLDIPSLSVVRWDGTGWVSEGKKGLVGDVNSGQITTGAPINQFGVFSLGSVVLAPQAVNDAFSTDEDVVLNGSLLTNDIDPQGFILRINQTPTINASHGNLIINLDGTFEYQPQANYHGQDGFTYEVCNESAFSTCSTAEVVITVNSVNDAPQATNDFFTTKEDVPVSGNLLLNDIDLDFDILALSTVPVSGPSHGTITLLQDGSFTYVPEQAYFGEDQILVEVCDNGSPIHCVQSTLTITVEYVNKPPTGENISTQVVENQQLDLCITATDIENDIISIGNVVAGPQNGSIININGLCFSYLPNHNYFGNDSFQMEICDALGCSVIDVNIEVTKMPLATYEAFSPNNDSYNDSWIIDGIHHFPNNEVIIFNRHGSVVYKLKNYNNEDKVWKGECNTSFTVGGNELPNGTYYFIINLGNGEGPKKGYVVLNR